MQTKKITPEEAALRIVAKAVESWGVWICPFFHVMTTDTPVVEIDDDWPSTGEMWNPPKSWAPRWDMVRSVYTDYLFVCELVEESLGYSTDVLIKINGVRFMVAWDPTVMSSGTARMIGLTILYERYGGPDGLVMKAEAAKREDPPCGWRTIWDRLLLVDRVEHLPVDGYPETHAGAIEIHIPGLTDPSPAPSKGPKVGRNAPCPCMSEKKFKRCCGKNAP